MPKNPSEIARLEAELSFCKSSLKEGYHSKSTKEYLIREVRRLEEQLGIAITKYNSNSF